MTPVRCGVGLVAGGGEGWCEGMPRGSSPLQRMKNFWPPLALALSGVECFSLAFAKWLLRLNRCCPFFRPSVKGTKEHFAESERWFCLFLEKFKLFVGEILGRLF